MKASIRLVRDACFLALAFAGGYLTSQALTDRVEPPPRTVADAVVPAGAATELRDALLLADGFERTAEVSRVLAPLGPDALPSVRAAYDSVVLDLGDVELIQLVEWWGRFDPPAAFAWARENRIGWHPATLSAIARVWARVDPAAASQAVRTVSDPSGPLFAASLQGLVRGWDESGQPGLVEFLLAAVAESGEAYAQAVDSLARARILREGPAAATAWADALPDTDYGGPTPFKAFATQRVAGMLAETDDPLRAAQWVAEKRARGQDYGLGPLLKVCVAWATRDPEAALRWLRALPPGSDVPTLVQETFRRWFVRDPEAASRWLEAQRPDPWLDPAIATVAQRKTLESFETAMDWGKRIQDVDLHDKTVGKIALAWLRKSPAEADAWLASAELSESARRHIATLRELRIERTKAAMDSRGAQGRSAPAPAPLDPMAPTESGAAAGAALQDR